VIPAWIFIVVVALLLILPRLKSINWGGRFSLDFGEEDEQRKIKGRQQRQLKK